MSTRSSAQMLRRGNYSCKLCKKHRFLSAAALRSHENSVHSIHVKKSPMKKIGNKGKKSTSKLISAHKSGTKVVSTTKVNTKPVKKKSKVLFKSKILVQDSKVTTQEKLVQETSPDINQTELQAYTIISFECPKCFKNYNDFFPAMKHIEQTHASGVQSGDVLPKKVEKCLYCSTKIKNGMHNCKKKLEKIDYANNYICNQCGKIFNSLKLFDLHVISEHHQNIVNLFFRDQIEYKNWKADLETQTGIEYKQLGDYNYKVVHRCSAAENKSLCNEQPQSEMILCPSSLIEQVFPKGVQIHFYPTHGCGSENTYKLPDEFQGCTLKNIIDRVKLEMRDDSCVISDELGLEQKELFSQFETIMKAIIGKAYKLDETTLKDLVCKALDMCRLITKDNMEKKYDHEEVVPVNEELYMEIERNLNMLHSTDSNKRTLDEQDLENSSLNSKRPCIKVKSPESLCEIPAPKIVNSFSLSNETDLQRIVNEYMSIDIDESAQEKQLNGAKNKSNNSTLFSQSSSFVDSFKDFVDKNFIPKKTKSKKENENVAATKDNSKKSNKTVCIVTDENNKKIDKFICISPVANTKTDNPMGITPNTSKKTESTLTPILKKKKPDKSVSSSPSTNLKEADKSISVRKSINSKIDKTCMVIPNRSKTDKALSTTTDATKEISNNNEQNKKDKHKIKTQNGVHKKQLMPIKKQKKNIVKTKIGQFKPGSPKSPKKLKIKEVKKVNKSLNEIKIEKYEVREQDNDCNILILKI